MRTAADRRPPRPRGDDDHGLRPRARRRPRPDGRAAGARGRALEPRAGGVAALCQLPDAGGPPRARRGRRRRRAAPRPREPRAPRHARPHPPRPQGLGPGRAGRRHPPRPGRNPVATAMAASLDAARLQGEGKPADAAAMLESLLGSAGGAATGKDRAIGGQALADLVRARLAAGEPGEARRAVEAALAADPASLPARFLLAGLDAIEGRTDEAEALLRALVAEAPALPEPHLALFRLLAGEGDLAGADAALEQGIAATGDGERRPPLPARRPARVARRPRRGDRRLRDPLRPLERQPGPRQQPREPADGARRLRSPPPSTAPMPSPGGCAAATCRSSRTPTAGSSSCAATPPRRGTLSPRRPRRSPATPRSSSTSARPSAPSATATRRRRPMPPPSPPPRPAAPCPRPRPPAPGRPSSPPLPRPRASGDPAPSPRCAGRRRPRDG